MTVTVLRQTDETHEIKGEPRPVFLVDHNGQEKRAVQLANGAFQEVGTGYFLSSGETQITPANARALQRKRWEQAQDAAGIGLSRIKPSCKTEFEAWSDIVQNMGSLALTGQGKESVMAAQFVMKAAGFEKDKAEIGEGGASVTLNLSMGAVNQLLRALSGQGDVIEAEFKNL